MNSTKKLLLLAALALTAFAASAGSASAASGVRITPGGAITQTSQGKVTFQAGETRIECNLTLTGRLETALVRFVRGTLTRLGQITRVDWRECVGGEVERVLNLPWNIALNTILENEPRNCTRVNEPFLAPYNTACGALIVILGPQFQLSIFGGFVRCLYGSAAERVGALLPLTRTGDNGREATYTMGLLTILANSFRLTSGFGCPATGEMRGRFNEASPRQTLTLLR